MRLADINGDGLPDILEAVMEVGDDGVPRYLSRAFLNNGYGWKVPDLSPEHEFYSPLLFLGVHSGTYGINENYCTDPEYTASIDYGVRVIDLNGDGAVDMIGGASSRAPLLGSEALIWTASLNGSSFWAGDSAWDIPVSFREGSSPAGGVRLADVNNDGWIDWQDLTCRPGAAYPDGENESYLLSAEGFE